MTRASQSPATVAGGVVVKGSPLRAVGMVLFLVGVAGVIGAGVQYVQFLGGEVVEAEVLRSDERVEGTETSYRALLRLQRPEGGVAEVYLDTRARLNAAEHVTVTYHRGTRREVVMGEGHLQRNLLWAFGAGGLLGVAMMVFGGAAKR